MGVTRKPIGLDSARQKQDIGEQIRELRILIATRDNYSTNQDNEGLKIKLEGLLRQQKEKK
jgi:hypothetical protein